MEYKVIKQHYGDKQYYAGDVRKVENQNTAEELMKMGLITADDDSEKSQTKPRNKADKTPVKNKVE